MKILVHGLSSGIGGVEIFLLNYCPQISKLYPEIEFEYVVYDAVPDYAESRGIELGSLHVVPGRGASLQGNRDALSRLVQEGHYDCVWGNYCSLSDVGVLQAATSSVPIRIAHAHSSKNMGSIFTALLHGLHKKSLENLATDLLSCSDDAAAFMFPKDVARDRGFRVVANGIDVERFAFDEDARKQLRNSVDAGDSLVLAYVGRMSPEKNPMFAIDVAKVLQDDGIDFRMVMLGDGPSMREVRTKVEVLNLADRVHLLGLVPQVEGWLSAADAFIMPSEFEGLGLSLIEAQASGVSCLISEGIPNEAIVTDQIQRLSLSDPIESWAQAAVKAGTDSRNRNRMESARIVADAGYDISENAAELGAWLLQRQREVQSEESSL